MSAPADAPGRSSARASQRVCSRQESARIGASLHTAESSLSDAQSELEKVKRRLRKYAHALEAVSKSAKEEIHIALEARNNALAEASTVAVERDTLAKNCDEFASQLKSHLEQSTELKRRFDVNNTCLTKAVSEVSRLRKELERSKRLAGDLRTKVNSYAHEKSNLSANLTSERLSKRGIIEERDGLQEDLNASNSELAAVKRELALVRHQLATRAPPEISQEVRDDIANRSASAVERRTVKIIKTIAKHFLEFKAEQMDIHHREIQPVENEDDDGVSAEGDVYVSREFVPNQIVSVANADDVDELGDLLDADSFLEKYLASIKLATTEADSKFPSSVFINSGPLLSGDDDSDETEEYESESSVEEDEEEQSVVVGSGHEVEEGVAKTKKQTPIDDPTEPTSVIVDESRAK